MAHHDDLRNLRHFYKHHWKVSFGQKGWLRPSVLGLLEKEPMNGAELINNMNKMTHGWWTPSPGSIYPLLQTLCEEGVIKKRKDGRYQIASKYKNEFSLADETEEVMSSINNYISYLEDLAQSDKNELKRYRKELEEFKKRISKLL